jgi:hypothetical protein
VTSNHIPPGSALHVVCQQYGICGTKTAKVAEFLKKFEVLSQAAKACKGHRVNKFGSKSVGTALLPICCLLKFFFNCVLSIHQLRLNVKPYFKNFLD